MMITIEIGYKGLRVIIQNAVVNIAKVFLMQSSVTLIGTLQQQNIKSHGKVQCRKS